MSINAKQPFYLIALYLPYSNPQAAKEQAWSKENDYF